MNHPDREAWVPYLFGDVTGAEKARLEAHLAACAPCRERVGEWRASRARLDAWKVGTPSPSRVRARGSWPGAVVLRWAAVVAVSVTAGAGGGFWAARRGATPETGPGSGQGAAMARATMPEPVIQEAIDRARAEEREDLRVAMERLREEQNARFLELRRDLETVAATTDVALRQARRGLIEVAGYRSNEDRRR